MSRQVTPSWLQKASIIQGSLGDSKVKAILFRLFLYVQMSP